MVWFVLVMMLTIFWYTLEWEDDPELLDRTINSIMKFIDKCKVVWEKLKEKVA